MSIDTIIQILVLVLALSAVYWRLKARVDRLEHNGLRHLKETFEKCQKGCYEALTNHKEKLEETDSDIHNIREVMVALHGDDPKIERLK